MPDRADAAGAVRPADDWAISTADTVERVVGTVRDKAVVPVTSIARWLVFGLLAAVLGLTAVALLAIGLVRVLVVYLFEENVWAAHLVTGGIFVLPGLFLWSRRSPRAES